MAKKKKAGPVEPATKETVTWPMVLNCEADLARTQIEHLARLAGLRYYVRGQDLFAVDHPDVLASADALAAGGVEVGRDGDGRVVSVAPRAGSYWVVSSLNWEYNDETYFVSGEGAGYPKRVFASEAAASAYAARHNVTQRCTTCDLFEYVGGDRNDADYEDLVAMPFDIWSDWLRDRRVEPPPAGPDGVPTGQNLDDWWRAGLGVYQYVPGGKYELVGGTWTPEQAAAAATHLRIDFCTVTELEAGDG